MSTSTSTLEAPKTATSSTPRETLWWSRGTHTWRELRGASHLVSLLPCGRDDGDYLAVRRSPCQPDRYAQIAQFPGQDRWAAKVGNTGCLTRQVYDAPSSAPSTSITRLQGITRDPDDAPTYAFDGQHARSRRSFALPPRCRRKSEPSVERKRPPNPSAQHGQVTQSGP